jgi:hypothetical protein
MTDPNIPSNNSADELGLRLEYFDSLDFSELTVDFPLPVSPRRLKMPA